jgi:hypothetical protein
VQGRWKQKERGGKAKKREITWGISFARLLIGGPPQAEERIVGVATAPFPH